MPRNVVCRILVLVLTVTVVEAVRPPGVNAQSPLGLSVHDLTGVRWAIRARAFDSWFGTLSPVAQRVLSDRSTQMVILWPTGRILYRAGNATAGDIYGVREETALATDYTHLKRHLSSNTYRKYLAAIHKSTHREYEEVEAFVEAFGALSDADLPEGDRTGYMAVLGERLAHLSPGSLNQLARSHPELLNTGALAFHRVENERWAMIQDGQPGTVDPESADEDLLSGLEEAIRHALAGSVPESGGDRILRIGLPDSRPGYLLLRSGAGLNWQALQNADAATLQAALQLYVSDPGSAMVLRVNDAALARAIRGEPHIDG